MSTSRQASSGLPPGSSPRWQERLQALLPLFGHRNWIAVVDSAYPAQASPGIETIATGASHLEVVGAVLAAVEEAPHVRPIVYTDSELALVSPADAPGVTEFRAGLATLLAQEPGAEARSMRHDAIIAKLDAAGATFSILVLKTSLTIPYTSVFVELDCGYWNADAERRLRSSLPAPL